MAETTINTRVTADASQFKSAMSDVGRGLLMAGGKASRFGTALNANFKALTVGASLLGATMSAQLFRKSSMEFIDFQDTLVRTQAVMGTTADQASNLEREIRDIAAATRFTAAQAAQATEVLAIAGVSYSELIDDKVIDKLVKFSIAGGIDIQTATNIGVAGVKAFRLEMADLDMVTDTLVNTFTKANVDVVNLGEAMKFSAPVAAAAGIEIAETAAAIGALGNAGLRGTVAGTGLRMAINKLLKPTFDARKIINELGLDIFVLSDAGKAANVALKATMSQMKVTERITAQLQMEVKQLQDALSDLSLSERRNSLAISQIRLRAASQNRELTDDEIERIRRLELANDNLSVKMQQREIDLQIASAAAEQAATKQAELKKRGDELTKTVEMQTTGLTSLTEMLRQMEAGGITAAQALEIFGVRGGTAALSLLSQREAFEELVASNEKATGRTEEFSQTLKQSPFESMKVALSKLSEEMITVGEIFVKHLFGMTKDGERFEGVLDGVASGFKQIVDDNRPKLEELAKLFAENLKLTIGILVSTIPMILNVVEAIIRIMPALAMTFKIMVALLQPVFQFVNGIMSLVNVFTDLIGVTDTGTSLFAALRDILEPILNVLFPVTLAFRILRDVFGGFFEPLDKVLNILYDLSFFLGGGFIFSIGKAGGRLAMFASRFPRLASLMSRVAGGFKGFAGSITRFVTAPFRLLNKLFASIISKLDKLKGAGSFIKRFIPKSPGSMVRDAVMATPTGRMISQGAAVGRGAAGLVEELASGGVVTQPTFSMVGEAGPEAVLPLNPSILSSLREAIASSTTTNTTDSSMSVNIGDIVINGDTRNPNEIKRVLEAELPRILSKSIRRGNTGVF